MTRFNKLRMRILAGVFVGFAVFGAYKLWMQSNIQWGAIGARFFSVDKKTHVKSSLGSSLVQDQIQVGSAAATPPAAWVGVMNSLGKGLLPRFSPDGVLLSVDQSQAHEVNPNSGGNLNDEEAISKARAFIDQLRPYLAQSAGFEYGRPSAQHAASGLIQVSFESVHQSTGETVAPYGSVTLHLSPAGEFIAFYSNSAVSGLKFENSKSLNLDQAQVAAQNALGNNRSLDAARPVIWQAYPKVASVRHAYEFISEGHQAIIDAQSGELIYRRDRRQN